MKHVFLLFVCLCLCLACPFSVLADEMTDPALDGEYGIMPLNDDGGSASSYMYSLMDPAGYVSYIFYATSNSSPIYAYSYGDVQVDPCGIVWISESPFTMLKDRFSDTGEVISKNSKESVVLDSDTGLYWACVRRMGTCGNIHETSYTNYKQILKEFAADNLVKDDIGDSGGGSSDDYFGDGGSTPWKYDSSIPSPVNFKCSVKKGSGLGSIVNPNSNSLYYLTWSNPEAVDCFVLLSARIKDRETGQLKTVWLEDTKKDVGYPASKGSYAPDWVAIEERYELLWGTYYPVSFELRFYRIDSGYVHTGNMARCILNVDSNGNYYGSTSESVDLDGSWNQTVRPEDTFTSDVNGNVTNVGGSGGSGGDGGSGGEGGNGNTVQGWLDNFLSIPSVLNQFFISIKNMMSGIGEVPALIGSMFSALPSEILAIMGIGVTLVVVLRIVGR